jgi:hypothetical protein
MIIPDYQYTPQLIPAIAALVGSRLYPGVLGSLAAVRCVAVCLCGNTSRTGF